MKRAKLSEKLLPFSDGLSEKHLSTSSRSFNKSTSSRELHFLDHQRLDSWKKGYIDGAKLLQSSELGGGEKDWAVVFDDLEEQIAEKMLPVLKHALDECKRTMKKQGAADGEPGNDATDKDAQIEAGRLRSIERELVDVDKKLDSSLTFVDHNRSVYHCVTLDAPADLKQEQDFDKLKNETLARGIRECLDEVERMKKDIRERSRQLGFDLASHKLHDEYQENRESFMFAMFLGVQAVCVLEIAYLVCKPATNPSYRDGDYQATMPVFRTSFMLSLLLWVAGAAVRFFERYCINYEMIINIDPLLHVSANSLFMVAQVQSAVYTSTFLAFLLDYKFSMLFNTAAAWRIYPMASAILTVCLWLLPLHISTWTWQAKKLLGNLFLAVMFPFLPCYPVTFAGNLLGDVLTSFAKPIKDALYTVLYVWTVFTAPTSSDTLDINRNDLNALDGTALYVAIIDLPYFFRLLQCFRRYVDTYDKSHLLNAGKYTVSILVTFAFLLDDYLGSDRTALVVVSVTATIYALIWDLYKDWGLRPYWSDIPELKVSCSIEGLHFYTLQEDELLTRDVIAQCRAAVADIVGVQFPTKITLFPGKYGNVKMDASVKGEFSLEETKASLHEQLARDVAAAIQALCKEVTITVGDVQVEATQSWDILCRKTFQNTEIYPRYVYKIFAVLDILGRLTWATTLIPSHFLVNNPEVWVYVWSSVELVRRGLWAVIRVENEQSNNSSKFRKTGAAVPALRKRDTVLNKAKRTTHYDFSTNNGSLLPS